jgi:hypothetical protein
MRLSACGAVILLLAFSAGALAQESTQPSAQDDPLAAAARQAREQKKQQSKPVRVWDNDNIPKSPASLSLAGQSAAETQAQNATADSQPAAATDDNKTAATDKNAPSPADKKKDLESQLAAAKEALQNLQNDLDIMQRKLALDQQMYYGKPDYASDKAGLAALNDEQSQIDAKQVEMGAAQQKIADLQAQLNALAEAKPAAK